MNLKIIFLCFDKFIILPTVPVCHDTAGRQPTGTAQTDNRPLLHGDDRRLSFPHPTRKNRRIFRMRRFVNRCSRSRTGRQLFSAGATYQYSVVTAPFCSYRSLAPNTFCRSGVR